MRVLITAFEPFGGESENAALEAVRRVRVPNGTELHKLTVPTVFGACVSVVAEAIERLCPDAIVCVGQAAGRRAITPERVAINVMDARIADNAGRMPVDEPIVRDGPAAYFSTLPIKAMCEAIRAAGILAEVSNTAGTYVCNNLMYGILHTLAVHGRKTPCGFVHVPCTPEQAAAFDPPLASMETDGIVKGLEAALTAL